MKLPDMFGSISKREKVLIIIAMVVLVGVLLFQAVTLFQEEQTKPTAVAPPKKPAAQIKAGPPMAKNLASIDIAKAKNPFEIPPEYQEQRYNATSNNSTLPPQLLKPALSGILSSGGGKVAIIDYNGNSEMVGPGAALGPYSVVSITDSEVILAGPDGQLVMNVGR